MGGKSSGTGTLEILVRVLSVVALCLCLLLMFTAYIETMWMKKEIKKEAVELRRMREQIERKMNEKPAVVKPVDAPDGLQ